MLSVGMKPTEAEKNFDGGKDAIREESDGKHVEPEKVVDLKSNNAGEVNEVSHKSPVSDAGWVCKSPNGSAVSGWRSFDTKATFNTNSLSAEEEETIAKLNLQLKGLKACKEYLVGDAGSDSDEDVINSEDEDEDESVDDDGDDDTEDSEDYKFFEKLFREDGELRKYYENNYKEGHFYCLVCGAVLKKVWKRFKDCNQLVQHSTAVLRTKRRRAHRAYAQFICKLVGWDANKLPAVVSKDSDFSSADSKKVLVEGEKPAASPNDKSNGEPGNADGHVDDSALTQ